jgi:hypothetical protein
MTPEDRDLLQSLRRQQADLQQSLEKLSAQLGALESRSGMPVAEVHPDLPPLPPEAILPPIPTAGEESPIFTLPPIPSDSGTPKVPPVRATQPAPSFEFRFGRMLIRIGAFFGVIALALILAWPKVQQVIGHMGLLAISAIISLFVVLWGNRMEQKGAGSFFLGRAVTLMALAWLYLTAYTACYIEPVRIIQSSLVAGFVLLAWSIYVLRLAERKKSQALAIFSLALAFVTTAITPIGWFTMGVDLFLAATAAMFLVSNGWATLATLSIVGTYLALLHRLLVDPYGDVILDTSRALSFTPHAIYLTFAWLIFTAAIILTREPDFRGAKRLFVLSLNNALLAILMALTAYIAGYGAGAIGWTLLDTGLVFLITSRFAGIADIDPVDIMGAYAAQGIALFTGGLIIIFTGMTRAVLLLVETFLIGIAGAFSGDRILTVSTYASAFFAAVFLLWEIAVYAHHPWLFGFAGTLVMLICAWNSRSEVRNGPMERNTIVLSASCYCIMAVGLIYAALSTELGDATLPPALALAALALTYVIYYFSLYELPALAQILLVAALTLVIFPTETGEELPWWSTAWVAAVTLLLLTWWSRQRVTRSGSWTMLMTFIYGLALADLAHLAIRPYLDAQGWIIGASLLSLVFLIFGAFTRVWTIAIVGQLFLALALYHFFLPPNPNVFPWAWWAAAVPVMVVYVTARMAHEWLRNFSDFPDSWRYPIRILINAYLLLALTALARWVFGAVPASEQMSLFLFLGTLVLSGSVRRFSTFGVRCSFALSTIGMWLYLDQPEAQAHVTATFLNGLAMFLFLCQPALLRHERNQLVTRAETWALIVFAVLTNWIFVSAWVLTRDNPGYLTLGWALFAFFLFLFGAIVRDRRLRWCGCFILVIAVLRVICWDIWNLSTGFRMLTGVLTFVTLAFILLVVGYIILRRSSAHHNA